MITTAPTAAEPVHRDLRFTIPATVSPEAASGLAMIYQVFADRPPEPPPTSLAEWDFRRDRLEQFVGLIGRQFAAAQSVTLHDDRLGEVPVVRIRPREYRANGRVLIYVHGGGYVVFSAKSALIIPTLVAAATGDEVISIDYTLAPRGTWRTATEQVIAVWQALLSAGYEPGRLGLFGDSAGGGLAAGSVLKMRDEGLGLPGALYLLSPWSDITATGDTYQTLADADPSLNMEALAAGAAVYAAPPDQKHPYVSPIYGDYSKAFPPTLLQGGTREIFLSNLVRHYQAIRGGGHEAVLDLYEGMPHVFQGLAPDSPETRTSIARAAAFFQVHLRGEATAAC